MYYFSSPLKSYKSRILSVLLAIFNFFSLFFIPQAASEPLLYSTATLWEDKTALYVGNCDNLSGLPNRIKIIEPIGKDSLLLDLVSNQEDNASSLSQLFGLWASKASQKSILYRMDSRGNLLEPIFELPFIASKGFLRIFSSYYANAWHRVLLLSAQDHLTEQSILVAFELSDRLQAIEPFVIFRPSTLAVLTTYPTMMRLTNGQYAIAVGGYRKLGESLTKVGFLYMLFLDSMTSSYYSLKEFQAGVDEVKHITALDIMQRGEGYADRLYVGDEHSLWGLDLSLLGRGSFTQFNLLKNLGGLNIKILNKPLFIPDIQGIGLQAYFLGGSLATMGLYQIHDPLELKESDPLLVEQRSFAESPKLLLKGDFIAGYLRFGQFWLVPRELTKVPVVIELGTQQFISVERNFILNEAAVDRGSNATKLLWDPKEQVEVLVTLNHSCQLIIEKICPRHNPYGRLTWQRKDLNK